MAVFRYFGNIAWFSQRSTKKSYGDVWNALRDHIHYIANEKRVDLVAKEGLEYEKWKEINDRERAKRWDSRIAGKFTLGLPNFLTVEEARGIVKEFLEKEVKTETFGLAFHRNLGCVSYEENFHVHIVFSARKRDGKKLRLDRKKLKELQKKWDEYLERYTKQKVYKAPERFPKWVRPHHLRKDSNAFNERAYEMIRKMYIASKMYKEALEAEKERELLFSELERKKDELKQKIEEFEEKIQRRKRELFRLKQEKEKMGVLGKLKEFFTREKESRIEKLREEIKKMMKKKNEAEKKYHESVKAIFEEKKKKEQWERERKVSLQGKSLSLSSPVRKGEGTSSSQEKREERQSLSGRETSFLRERSLRERRKRWLNSMK